VFEKTAITEGVALAAGVSSPAIRCGDWVFVSGQAAVTPDGEVVAPGDPEEQVRHVAASLDRILAAAGGSRGDLLHASVLVHDAGRIEPVLAVLRTELGGRLPALHAGAFAAAPLPGVAVTVQATARLGVESRLDVPADEGSGLAAAGVPAACRKAGAVFGTAQHALEADGTVAAPGDHCGQARIAYRRLLTAVEAAGGTVGDIIDFTSFHHDIRGADATLQEVYGPEVLGPVGDDELAATSHLGLPGLVRPGVLGAYGAIADLSPGGRVSVTPDGIWWKGVLPVAGGARKAGGNLVAVAGQVACGPTGEVIARGDFSAQARYVLEEMRAVLEGFGGSLANVVSVTSYHQDLRSWPEVRAVAHELFGDDVLRAWTPVGVAGLWMEGYLHEISALALL
jgi:enamine deaminase RidA (YjgF/YER057c/UK114 family)